MLATLKRESLREPLSARVGEASLSQNVLDVVFAAAHVAT